MIFINKSSNLHNTKSYSLKTHPERPLYPPPALAWSVWCTGHLRLWCSAGYKQQISRFSDRWLVRRSAGGFSPCVFSLSFRLNSCFANQQSFNGSFKWSLLSSASHWPIEGCLVQLENTELAYWQTFSLNRSHGTYSHNQVFVDLLILYFFLLIFWYKRAQCLEVRGLNLSILFTLPLRHFLFIICSRNCMWSMR